MSPNLLVTILAPIALALINAGVLYILSRLFKEKTISYGKSLFVYISTTLITLVVCFAFAFFKQATLGLLVGIFIAFLWFRWLFHHQYHVTWPKTLGIYVLSHILFLLITMLLFVTVLPYLTLQPFVIQGGSMIPTYQGGEYGVINVLNRDFKRGDVIVFTYTHNSNKYHIGRIVGLPSEEVEIRRNGYVYIDGQRLEERYLAGSEVATLPDTRITLGADEYFILGDNRGTSSDSRHRGPVSRNNIIGVFNEIFGR